MIITRKEILKRMSKGEIVIEPFDVARLGPVSYDLCIGDSIGTYDRVELDMKRDNPYSITKIPESGFLLHPGKGYLAVTKERTETYGDLVPEIDGRSSSGRLFICAHQTAGRGDPFFRGYWTLELTCTQPIRIYANIPICQIYYILTYGEVEPYNGRYQDQPNVPVSSKLFNT